MKTIEQLAREAGAGFECSTLTVNGKDAHDFIERFHDAAIAQYREGLLAGVGEPEGSAEVFTGMNEHGLPEYAHVDAYTADQLASAVLREREACAQKCEEREACAQKCEEYDGTWYAYRKGAQECAAAIRGQK